MAFLNVKNRAESTLASGISDSDLSLTVASGEGVKFPASNFHITIEDEILLCSSRTGDVLTVERGKEGTTPAAHVAEETVELRITAQIIQDLIDRGFLSLVDTPASYSGQAGKYLKVNAVPDALEFTDPPAGAEYWENKIRLSYAFQSLDALTVAVDGTGTVILGFGSLDFKTENISGYRAGIRSFRTFRPFIVSGKKLTVEWVIKFLRQWGEHRFNLIGSSSLPAAETIKHIGLKVVEGSLFASSADGTTQKLTDTDIDVGALNVHVMDRYRAVFDPGVNCKFYYNDVLKVTHTENLPNVANYDMYLWTGVKTTAAAPRELKINRFLIEREY